MLYHACDLPVGENVPVNSPHRPDRIIIYYAPIIIWMGAARGLEHAFILALSPEAGAVANTGVIMDLLNRQVLVAMLVAFSIMSLLACTGKIRSVSGLILFLWPQQALLSISALGAARSIWLGLYADGHAQAVISQDQTTLIWLVTGHGLAVWHLMHFIRRT